MEVRVVEIILDHIRGYSIYTALIYNSYFRNFISSYIECTVKRENMIINTKTPKTCKISLQLFTILLY